MIIISETTAKQRQLLLVHALVHEVCSILVDVKIAYTYFTINYCRVLVPQERVFRISLHRA